MPGCLPARPHQDVHWGHCTGRQASTRQSRVLHDLVVTPTCLPGFHAASDSWSMLPPSLRLPTCLPHLPSAPWSPSPPALPCRAVPCRAVIHPPSDLEGREQARQGTDSTPSPCLTACLPGFALSFPQTLLSPALPPLHCLFSVPTSIAKVQLYHPPARVHWCVRVCVSRLSQPSQSGNYSNDSGAKALGPGRWWLAAWRSRPDATRSIVTLALCSL